jgi:pilus assembly protein CpaC
MGRISKGLMVIAMGYGAILPLQAESPPIGDHITMYAGQALVQSAPGPIKRVAVGDGKTLEVKNVGTRELVLIGQRAGDTSIQLWLANGEQRSVSVHVTAGNGEQMAESVRQMLGNDPAFTVSVAGNNVVVTGGNLSPGQAAAVESIHKLYPDVINLTSADPVAMKPTVLMQVRIMEFDKKAMHDIGIKWDTQIQGPGGGLLHDWQTNPYFRVIPPDPGLANLDKFPLHVPGTPSYFGIATTIGSRINLAMQTGNAWELATPQLSAKSGGSADFLVGGQVPIPTSSTLGTTTVEYKDYGIKLHLEPLVNANGDISAKIETELSKIDPSVMVGPYPGFITRRANTEMNVHEGETIVISGLIDANASNTLDKMPGLGQIPILGELFRSRSFQANRTDLVVFVTPYVIDAQSQKNKDLVKHSDDLNQKFHQEVGADIVD